MIPWTGFPSLDDAIGTCRFPEGRIVELSGGPGASAVALGLVASVQRRGATAAIIDTAGDFSNVAGLDLSKLLVSQPENGRQAMEIAETLVRSGAVNLLVIDSLQGATPDVDLLVAEDRFGVRARLFARSLRTITAVAYRTGTCVVFVNRRVGREECPGANALKFYASLRLDAHPRGEGRSLVRVVKNKLAPPFGEAEIDWSAQP